MNNAAIDYTARIAATRSADIAADVAAARAARRVRSTPVPAVAGSPSGRRRWTRWLAAPAPRPAH